MSAMITQYDLFSVEKNLMNMQVIETTLSCYFLSILHKKYRSTLSLSNTFSTFMVEDNDDF